MGVSQMGGQLIAGSVQRRVRPSGWSGKRRSEEEPRTRVEHRQDIGLELSGSMTGAPAPRHFGLQARLLVQADLNGRRVSSASVWAGVQSVPDDVRQRLLEIVLASGSSQASAPGKRAILWRRGRIILAWPGDARARGRSLKTFIALARLRWYGQRP
jgi:hypothetical protein